MRIFVGPDCIEASVAASQEAWVAAAGTERRLLLMPPPPAAPGIAELAGDLNAAARATQPSLCVERIRPRSLLSVVAASPRWTAIPSHSGAERFGEVVLPAAVASSPAIVVSGIRGPYSGSPIGLLTTFAHPRQRVAAAADRSHAGAAELATAVPVREVWIVGPALGSTVVAVSETLLAAQLVWWALGGHDASKDLPGPWERPDVQRLAQMENLPNRPDHLRVAIHCAERPTFDALASLVRDRLGPVALGVGGD